MFVEVEQLHMLITAGIWCQLLMPQILWQIFVRCGCSDLVSYTHISESSVVINITGVLLICLLVARDTCKVLFCPLPNYDFLHVICNIILLSSLSSCVCRTVPRRRGTCCCRTLSWPTLYFRHKWSCGLLTQR